jgi:hypothetical protein
MKVTNWRRTLAANLVACGLLAPSAAFAQSLNTNVLANPSFENVGAETCCYNASRILDWDDGTQPGWAYNYAVYYDAGGPLAGGGTYYFTSNANSLIGGEFAPDVTQPGQVSQNVSLSGAAAAQIASGEAAVKLKAFFTSYDDDSDVGHLHVEFLNSSGGSLGSTEIAATQDPITAWHQVNGVGFIPVGTVTLKTSVYGTSNQFGPDGYIDLVDVQVADAEDELIFLEVNTTNGEVSIRNNAGEPFNIDYYEIRAAHPGDYNSDGAVDAGDFVTWRKTDGSMAGYNLWKQHFGETSNSLDPVDWDSLEEQDLAEFPAGDGTGNGWEEAGGSSGSILSEAFLTGNSAVVHTEDIDLGPAFNVGSPQTLEFYYGVVSGSEGPGTLVRGFVRYVTSGAGGGSGVPEPSSVLLIGVGLAAAVAGGRNRAKE